MADSIIWDRRQRQHLQINQFMTSGSSSTAAPTLRATLSLYLWSIMLWQIAGKRCTTFFRSDLLFQTVEFPVKVQGRSINLDCFAKERNQNVFSGCVKLGSAICSLAFQSCGSIRSHHRILWPKWRQAYMYHSLANLCQLFQFGEWQPVIILTPLLKQVFWLIAMTFECHGEYFCRNEITFHFLLLTLSFLWFATAKSPAVDCQKASNWF